MGIINILQECNKQYNVDAYHLAYSHLNARLQGDLGHPGSGSETGWHHDGNDDLDGGGAGYESQDTTQDHGRAPEHSDNGALDNVSLLLYIGLAFSFFLNGAYNAEVPLFTSPSCCQLHR